MHQRLLSYEDISSDCILMLDDDVALQPDSIEKLLKAMEENDADLIGADSFESHRLPFKVKLYSAISNLVFPHFSKKQAFKIHQNGSFSYISNPQKDYYPSQSCGGNAMLWRVESYRKLRLRDELWLDHFPFAHGDDMLESYKVWRNGMTLGVVFNTGIRHIDNRTASDGFRRSPDHVMNRTAAMTAVWYRSLYNPGDTGTMQKIITSMAFSLKMGWLFNMMALYSILRFNFRYLCDFCMGLRKGLRFVHTSDFRMLPPYVISRKKQS